MPASLLQAWERLVRADPVAVALIDAEGKAWSRTALDALGAGWASERGPALGGRLVLFAEPNGAGWLKVFIGLLRAGAVVAPLDPGEPPSVQIAVARKAGAACLWSGASLERIEGRSRIHRDGRRVVKLTSGTTGDPRALPFTDAQMLADGRQICAAMGIRAEDRNMGLIPFGHSYGLGNLIVPLLAQGTAVVCPPSVLPHAVAAAVERWRATVFPAVPAILRALLHSGVAPAQVRSLRTVISAGAPLDADLALAFAERFGLKIHNFYGSTETGGIAYDRTGEAAGRGAVGRLLRGVRLEFGRGRRFIVSSPAVHTLGNRRRRGACGAHSPADFGRLDRDGLRLLGRAGCWIKIGGRRLNPIEVERAIRGAAGVEAALVLPHPERPDSLAAAVAGTVSAEALRAHLVPALAAWKIPKKLLILPAFPLTPRGKTDVRRLRALMQGQRVCG